MLNNYLVPGTRVLINTKRRTIAWRINADKTCGTSTANLLRLPSLRTTRCISVVYVYYTKYYRASPHRSYAPQRSACGRRCRQVEAESATTAVSYSYREGVHQGAFIVESQVGQRRSKNTLHPSYTRRITMIHTYYIFG